MKLAIVGSREIENISLEAYIPEDVDEIITGGARGVDTCAAEYAMAHGLKLTEILPEYSRYGRGAPIVRNRKIVDAADKVIVFWNGSSAGSQSVIDYAANIEKPCEVILCPTSLLQNDDEFAII